MMRALSYDLATWRVLWRRDFLHLWHQPWRITSAFAQPVIFWLLIATGVSATLRPTPNDAEPLLFFFPGMLALVALFATVFANASLIEDKNLGFLRAVLTAPGASYAVVLGKCCGSTGLALLHAAAFVSLAPFVGFNLANIDWTLVAATIALASLSGSALGVSLAWLCPDGRLYYALQMAIWAPLWLTSGALFHPAAQQEWLLQVALFNPLTYVVAAMQRAFLGQMPVTPAAALSSSMPLCLSILGGLSAVLLFAACLIARRR